MRGAITAPHPFLRPALLYPKLFMTAALLGLFTAHPATANAQASRAVVPATREFETRAELHAAAATAEQQGRTQEAWLLRSRLERGDFQEGDRIVLTLENNPTVDTLKVRADKIVLLNGLPDLSLAGVLRSELTDTLRAHLAKYLKEPAVRATPLLPISVLGSVAQPGFYYFAADMVLRDVIMAAGGPAGADLGKIVVRRGGETIWTADDVRVALADGLSLDRLHLRAGDEVLVPQRREMNASTVVSIASAATALILVILQIVAR